MITVPITAKGQVLTLENLNNLFYAHTQKFIQFQFSFSHEWDNLNKIVQFTQNGKGYNADLGDSESTCFLPYDIGKGICHLFLYGYDDDNTIAITGCLTLYVEECGLIDDAENVVLTDSTAMSDLLKAIEKAEVTQSALENSVSTVEEALAKVTEFLNSDLSTITLTLADLDDRVSVLEVKADDIATDEETTEMLTEIFG